MKNHVGIQSASPTNHGLTNSVVPAKVVIALAAALWLLGIGSLGIVALGDWRGEKDIPMVVLFLLLSVFLFTFSAGLALFAATIAAYLFLTAIPLLIILAGFLLPAGDASHRTSFVQFAPMGCLTFYKHNRRAA